MWILAGVGVTRNGFLGILNLPWHRLALLELSELCQGVPSKAQLLAAKAKSGSFEKCLGRISCRPRVYPNSKARQMPLLRQISRGGKQRVLFDHVCMFALWFKDFVYFRAAFQLAGGVGLSSKCTPFDHRDLSNTYMHHFTNTTIYHISFCMQLRDCSPSYSAWTITKNLWL